MTTWPRTLTEAERTAILDDQIERFAWDGWRPLHRTATSITLTRRKHLSVGAAIFWALFLLVGLLVYLLVYMGRRDPVVRLTVTEEGRVRGEWSDSGEDWPKLPGEWVCRTCAYPNSRQHVACPRCHSPR
jgi:uncharacterized paraquat-inducible protein A